MYKFTVLRKSGFGDYATVVQRVCDILGNQFEFVVINGKKYNNYHCKELDFLSLFYNGEYLDARPGLKTFKLKDVIERKVELDSIFCIDIDVDKEGFNSIFNQKYIPCETRRIFNYKPQTNPFGDLKNKFVIHIRIASKRIVINLHKLEEFLLTLNVYPMNCIICSDVEDNRILKKIREFDSKRVNIVNRFIGKDKYATISTMDAFYYCDKIISKSSCFAYIFNKPVIDVPDKYCYNLMKLNL